MTLDQAFEDHIKLAVRLQSGRPLRAHRREPVTAQTLQDELSALEQAKEFEDRERLDGCADARYAVDALIDSAADAAFKGAWTRRNTDAHVGHNFYARMVAAHDRGPAGQQVLDVYALCALLGFSGDLHARSQEKVSRAIASATDFSPKVAISWRPAAVEAHGDVTQAHRLLTVAVVATVVTYLSWLSVLWGMRIAFGI